MPSTPLPPTCFTSGWALIRQKAQGLKPNGERSNSDGADAARTAARTGAPPRLMPAPPAPASSRPPPPASARPPPLSQTPQIELFGAVPPAVSADRIRAHSIGSRSPLRLRSVTAARPLALGGHGPGRLAT